MKDKTIDIPNGLKSIFDLFIAIGFFGFFISSIFVYYDILLPNASIIPFLLLVIILFVFLYFFRNKIIQLVTYCLNMISKIDSKKIIIFLVLFIIGIQMIYWSIAFFDSTRGGDISIYKQIGNDLQQFGKTPMTGLPPHLLSIGTILAVCNILNIPYFILTELLFILAIVCNFLSFSRIIGKEKAVFCISLFILMPSISLWPLCITHEVFLFFFLSLLFFSYLTLIENKLNIKFILMMIFALIGAILISPMGVICFITLMLITVFLNLQNKKKIIMITIIVGAFILGNFVFRNNINSFFVNQNDKSESTISWFLFVGSNKDTDGRYLSNERELINQYIIDNKLENEEDAFAIASKALLIERYSNLLSNPKDVFELLCKKFYIAWSGNHYSVELSARYRIEDGLASKEILQQYILLGISGVIYSFMMAIGVIGIIGNKGKRDYKIYVYKCMLLGVIAVLLLSEIMNKYATHQTLFIFLIAMSYFGFDKVNND